MSGDERIEADYAEPVSYEDLARVVTEPDRLRAENQRLREALEKLAVDSQYGTWQRVLAVEALVRDTE